MMISRRSFIAGSASVAVLAALAACDKKESASSGGSVSSSDLAASDINPMERDKVQDGGTFVMPIEDWITNFNPNTPEGSNGDNQSRLGMWTRPTNFIFDAHGERSLNNNFLLDTNVEEVDGKTVVTLKLNPAAKWNNGESITWEDYAATKAACDGSDPAFAEVIGSDDGYRDMESVVRGADDYEVIITYKFAFPDWSQPIDEVLPRFLCTDAETYNSWTTPEQTEYASGPFIISEADKTKGTLTLTRNPNWWGDPGKLDTVVLKVIGADQAPAAFANKEIDCVNSIIDSASYEQCSSREDGVIRQSSGLSWRHFTINGEAGVLQDQALRKALLPAIDRLTMAKADLQGLPVPAEELILGNHFYMPVQEGYQNNAPEFDPEATKKALDELGWVLPEGGTVREKDGEKLSIKYLRLPNTSTSANEGKILQENFAKVGCEVVMDDVAPADFFPRITEGNFEIVTFTWTGTPYPVANVGQVYGKGQGGNYAHVWSQEIQDLMPKIAGEMDPQKRIELANECDRAVWDLAAVIPIYNRASYTAVPSNLANYGSYGLQTVRSEDIGYVKA
ncbi:ABC transporter family substrate-binding protein [Actinomyces vulturis]|uniref:ABC transporter family substrate-binding protein n=1 Tax=Actinomyces vulturis TaxID=1857645 RepID=UPI000829E03D|nr:ABC transporter family substrate-binding protein [Actinomyces vulturis]